MVNLTDAELHAPRNLVEKRLGTVTAFLNIADAQRLTHLGLASRSRQGWDITPAGRALLAPEPRPAPRSHRLATAGVQPATSARGRQAVIT